jgi:hypothetical protein
LKIRRNINKRKKILAHWCIYCFYTWDLQTMYTVHVVCFLENLQSFFSFKLTSLFPSISLSRKGKRFCPCLRCRPPLSPHIPSLHSENSNFPGSFPLLAELIKLRESDGGSRRKKTVLAGGGNIAHPPSTLLRLTFKSGCRKKDIN